jgi:SET domain-containing protein
MARPEGVRVARSAISGRGLFATKSFRRGDFVCEYRGKLYRRDYEPSANRYLVEVNGHWTLDGSTMKNIGRWVNHSCRPNAKMIIKGRRVFYRALRKIKPGEEVFIHYGDEYVTYFLKTCQCPSCREER